MIVIVVLRVELLSWLNSVCLHLTVFIILYINSAFNAYSIAGTRFIIGIILVACDSATRRRQCKTVQRVRYVVDKTIAANL